jgi:hypothetical protein
LHPPRASRSIATDERKTKRKMRDYIVEYALKGTRGNMNRILNIWWKIAFIAAVFDVATLPVWIIIHFGLYGKFIPIPLLIPLFAILALPVAYLLIFSLWHWRTRYVGRHPLAWPILFVITAWPLFSTLPGSVFASVAYCLLNILPDARGRGAYAPSVPLALSPPASPLPANYQLAKSACFVLGWSMVIGGVLAAATTCIGVFVIWNRFEIMIPHQIGQQFTESMSSALWVGSQVAKVCGVTCLLAAIAAAGGAVLIQISQRLRWRLLDEQDKEEIKKGI